MINNSNWYRWDRLAAKSLDQQFVNEIIHGLNCSPFEAEAVLESVYRVFGDYFDTSDNLKPGQIKLSVVSIEASSTQRLSDAKQLTVTLTLTDDKEDLPIRKQSGVVGLRRHRIQRICQQAQDHIKNRNGAVSVFIDPEKIELIKLAEDHSNRNALEGRVVQMIEENGKIRVVVDAGVWIALLISKKCYDETRPLVGDYIGIRIPAAAIQLF